MTAQELRSKLWEDLRRKPDATLRDIAKLLECEKAGNYRPMFETDLYTKYSGEYCRLLELLSWDLTDRIRREMTIDMWHGHTFRPGKYQADAFFHPHGGLFGYSYTGNIYDETGATIGDYATGDSALIERAFITSCEEAI